MYRELIVFIFFKTAWTVFLFFIVELLAINIVADSLSPFYQFRRMSKITRK